MLPPFFPLAKDELSFVFIFLLRMLSSLLLSSLLGGLLVNVCCTAKLVLMKVLIKEKRKILGKSSLTNREFEGTDVTDLEFGEGEFLSILEIGICQQC